MPRSLLVLPLLLLLPACGPDLGDTAPGLCEAEPQLTVSGTTLGFEIRDCAELSLEARVVGEGELTVELAVDGSVVTPTVTAGAGDATLRALALEGRAELEGPEPSRWWRQGYQSWSWAGVVEPEPVTLDDDGLPEVGGQDVNTSFIQDTPFSAWWSGLLGRSDGASVLLGALAAQRVPFYTASSDSGDIWAVWGGFDEVYELGPGESLELEPLWIGADAEAWELWLRYARATAEHMPPRTLEDKPTVGWSSWYTYYADVTEQDVRGNLEVIADLNATGSHAPVEMVQVDDGWQVVWGERTASDKLR